MGIIGIDAAAIIGWTQAFGAGRGGFFDPGRIYAYCTPLRNHIPRGWKARAECGYAGIRLLSEIGKQSDTCAQLRIPIAFSITARPAQQTFYKFVEFPTDTGSWVRIFRVLLVAICELGVTARAFQPRGMWLRRGVQ